MQNSSVYRIMQLGTSTVLQNAVKGKNRILCLCPHSAQDCEFFIQMKMLVNNKKKHQKMKHSALYEIVLLSETDSFSKRPKTENKVFCLCVQTEHNIVNFSKK